MRYHSKQWNHIHYYTLGKSNLTISKTFQSCVVKNYFKPAIAQVITGIFTISTMHQSRKICLN
jgi:hypothetical protein